MGEVAHIQKKYDAHNPADRFFLLFIFAFLKNRHTTLMGHARRTLLWPLHAQLDQPLQKFPPFH